MLEALQSMPDQKVKTAKVSMWIKKTTALEIDNEDTIPQEYFREKRSIELDKTKLKNDLEEGVSVQGACIKENQSIVIARFQLLLKECKAQSPGPSGPSLLRSICSLNSLTMTAGIQTSALAV